MGPHPFIEGAVMLTADLKINGVLISHVYIVRDRNAPLFPADNDELRYHFELYKPGTTEVFAGDISHRYGDGGEELVRKVLEAYINRS